MLKTIILFVLFSSAVFSQSPNEYRPWEKFREIEKPKLLILGTFHFKDAGLDSYKPKVPFNVMEAERQKEVEDLVARIAEFKPTKIAVEWKTHDQNHLDSLYNAYLAGDFILRENEIYQVSFRLGKLLGHKKLYCADAKAKWYTDIPDKEEFGKKYSQEKYFDTSYNDMYQSLYQELDSLKSIIPLKEYLAILNNPEMLSVYLGHYLIGSFKVGAEGENPGADMVTPWFNRNLRILANLMQLAENKNERVFFMVGVGHVPIIRHAALSNPEIELIDVSQYLK